MSTLKILRYRSEWHEGLRMTGRLSSWTKRSAVKDLLCRR